MNEIDSYTISNKTYWMGMGNEHLILTYKIWSDAELSDGREPYDYFDEEDITVEDIEEIAFY